MESHNMSDIKSLLDLFINEQDSVNRNELITAIDVEKFNFPIFPEELRKKIEKFLIECACLYNSYGCPQHIIEVNMPKVAKGLGVECDFAGFVFFDNSSLSKFNFMSY